MKTQSLACALITGMLITSTAQAADAEVTIRVMDINDNSQESVMQIIDLPDETQLQQTQQQRNSTTEQSQLQQREMEMQKMEIEVQHNQSLQEHQIDQDNMTQQNIELQNTQENIGGTPGQQH